MGVQKDFTGCSLLALRPSTTTSTHRVLMSRCYWLYRAKTNSVVDFTPELRMTPTCGDRYQMLRAP